MSQSVVQVQQTEMQLWLDKVEAWGQSDSVDVQKDTCFHLSTLRDFLQRLVVNINGMSSTTETMKKMPYLGQILGRLCWNPVVTADDKSRALIFQCLWGLYSEQPANALERTANKWMQNLLCQLTTEEDQSPSIVLLKHLNVSPTQYHLQVLRKVVAKLQENIGKSCSSLGDINERCSCNRIVATCEACIPLVTCPEVAPLIGSLLQRPFVCPQAALGCDFLDALSSAYTSGCLSLEERAVVALWYHSLPNLEEAVLCLLESTVLVDTPLSLQQLEQQIAQSLLPKACAQHCSIFLVVNDIFRSLLKKQEDQPRIRDLIHSFTSCFYREVTLSRAQTPLKAFFPQSPQNLLLPLLTHPPEASGEARRHHLNWLSGSLRGLTEEEEEAGGGGGVVFEAWFLLVQCSHWMQEALQVLANAEPRDCYPLLWLLTFYHHPTNRGHHRNQRLVCVQQVWDQLHLLFSAPTPHPLPRLLVPVEPLHDLLALVSPSARRPSPFLILGLVVNCAVFSRQSQSVSTHAVRMVAAASGPVSRAAHVLSQLEQRLDMGSGGSGTLSDPDTTSVRIRRLQNELATYTPPLDLTDAGHAYHPHSPRWDLTHARTQWTLTHPVSGLGRAVGVPQTFRVVATSAPPFCTIACHLLVCCQQPWRKQRERGTYDGTGATCHTHL
ncbi:Fanconi anemia group C protein isoform X2 [Phycodurus eques]|nr:Fanconi anemia group C protein isoform X2 [Phycodurus eques]XP_061527891.1 Fanconi anemia group C protein isoform X2 [Phycodurus eques]